MLNSALIAGDGVYHIRSGVGTDKFGSRYGYSADQNSTPPWNQAGGGTGTPLVFGGLDNIYVKLSGTYYQILGFSNAFGATTTFTLLHPNQSDTSALPSNLFTSLTTELGTLSTSDTQAVTFVSSFGNPGFKATTWQWNLPQPNINGTSSTTTITFSITE